MSIAEGQYPAYPSSVECYEARVTGSVAIRWSGAE